MRPLALLRRRPEPPINRDGGPLRAMVQRLAHTPVHGMAIVQGRWWAHTAWGFFPVQHYLQHAHQQRTEAGHGPEAA